MAATGKSGKSGEAGKAGKAGKAAKKAAVKARKTAAKKAAKKTAVKTASKKAANNKKAANKKTPGRNAAAKSVAKKRTTAKAVGKKSGQKKSGEKKAAGGKSSAQTLAPGKSVAKKERAKKTAMKKAGAVKPAAKQTAAKKTANRKSQATKKASPAIVGGINSKAAGRAKPPAKKTGATVPNGSVFAPAARKRAQSRRTGKILHPPLEKAHRLAARTPVGWKTTVKRLRGFSAKELQELRDNYEPRSVAIRPAAVSDHQAITALLSHAFSGPAEDGLVKNLRGGEHMICELVAEYHDVIVGYAGFIRIDAELDGAPVHVAGLAPLAVESAFRGLGIGRRLVVGGLPEARAAGAEAVFVLGDPEYYAAMGFSTKPVQRFDSPYPAGKLSVIEFSPGRLSGDRGRLKYPAPFDA